MALERIAMFFTGYFLAIDVSKSIVLLLLSLTTHLLEYEFEYRYHVQLEKEYSKEVATVWS
jgi:hypothetical protein